MQNPFTRFIINASKFSIGLGNVDNTSDINKPVSTAQAAADTAVLNAANAHSDSLTLVLWDDRGSFDASVNTFPTTGGSGTAGAILKGDIWTISVAATAGPLLGYQVGSTVRAIIDTPGQTVGNWSILEVGLGYVPENIANKAITMTGNTASDIIYLSAKAIYTWVTGLFISPVFTGTGSGNFNGFANAYVIPANVGGTANAITLTPSPAITTYQEGQEFLFDAKATNTIVSPTIAINGLTPVLLTTMGSVALPIGGLAIGQLYRVRVEGTGPFTARVAPYDAVSSNGDTINGPLLIKMAGTTQMTTTNTAAQSALGGSGFISGHDSGAPMTAGNRLGFSLFSGAYDTLHSMGNSVGFAGFATETYNAGAMGGKFVIYTTPNGTTNRQIVATFDQDGTVEFLGAIKAPSISGLQTMLTQGDQMKVSLDTSPFREGSWATSTLGALYTLIGNFAMKYWTHNTAIDTNGDFLGRDDAGTATVWAFTEGDKEVTYSSASDTAGTVPSVWTKTREFDAATGNVTYLGNVTANNVSGVNSGNETSASIAVIHNSATAKTTIVDADEFTGQDSASTFNLMKVTALNMYNYMKTKFDAVYLTAASINTLTNKTFDTLVNTFTVGADISMASHKITNLTPGTAANDAATVSQISTGSLPVNPVAVPNGINDTLSAPPGTPVINESYLVAATATGAWTGLEGHIVNWNGSVWIDVLGRAVIAGDRLGLAIEHGTVAGGFATKTGNIAQVVVATPGSYTYTFTAPAGNMVFTVNGVNSTDYGHQYTYNGTSLIWVETGVGGQNMAVEVHNAAGKTTPVDADEFGITDSATSYGLKHLTFANLKATLLVYFNTAYVALTGNQSIAGIKTFSTQLIVPAPTNLTSTSNDAVALNTIFSLTWKTPVAVVSTTNQNIGAFVAGTVIDGVTCTQGTNILLVGQTAAQENGVFVVQAGTAALVRRADFDLASNFIGAILVVNYGSTYPSTTWQCTTAPAILGTNSIVFTLVKETVPTRVRAMNPGTQSISTGTIVLFSTAAANCFDTNTEFASNTFTAHTPGYFTISSTVSCTPMSLSPGSGGKLGIFKNATLMQVGRYISNQSAIAGVMYPSMSVDTTLLLAAGDSIYIRFISNFTATTAGAPHSSISINKIL